ncbi:MAG: regulator [Bacteroidetes bacterium]|nr:regulator [Bacteroidota bacterium]
MIRFVFFFLGLFFFNAVFGQSFSLQPAQQKEKGFVQEYHDPYPLGEGMGDNNIRSIAVDGLSNVYIATASGVFKKREGSSNWSAISFQASDKGPAYVVAVDSLGTLWIGNWKGVFQYQNESLKQVLGTSGPISVLCVAKEGIYALGPKGVWLSSGNGFLKKNYPIAGSVRRAISDQQEGLWIATDVGLYFSNGKGTTLFHDTSMLQSAFVKGLAFDQGGNLWAAGMGGISVISHEKRKRSIGTAEGCSSVYLSCVNSDADGTMWVGSDIGLVRFYADGSHSLLFSRRWLLDDQVNDIAFDRSGNAWVATAKGVSAIKRKWMTLDEKEKYFYSIQIRRHIRAPWISGQCYLPIAGDTTRWEPQDDDNDGEYTGNYLAMESFRYAVTHSTDAKDKARKAFDFLKELKDITNGDGYFARSMVPVEWADKVHDPNRAYTEREKAEELVKEPRFKPVTTRWHKSADGKWFWKGDASSDEWCGHMMAYFFYYELAADENEKKRIAQHVGSLVDHLIAHDFTMVDVDGTHTRWSVWSPELLNHNPEWLPDRCQNSMELLAFLKLAYYLTNNEKYQQAYLRLIQQEHYLENMAALFDQNPAWFIYFDVVLQAYIYPILLHCEKDPKLLAFYQKHIDRWMEARKNDKSPLINFFYSYARNKKMGMEDARDFLIDTPLDLVDWPIDHRKREDIRLVHVPMLESVQVDQLPPASIRNTVRWDRNPWDAKGGDSHIEREPVFWLLPYWMGRYLKMID